MHADCSHQLYGVSSDTLVRLASGLSEQCVKKHCGLAVLCFRGRMVLDLRLSRVHTGVAEMGQDCNYQLDTTKLGRKYIYFLNTRFQGFRLVDTVMCIVMDTIWF